MATTTTIASAPNPSVFGQSVTFTATVSVVPPATGAATGNVTFMNGTTSLGSASVANGTATFSTSSLAVGSHTITAVYAGGANFGSSTSSTAAIQVVNQAATTTTVASAANPSAYGQPVTFTATVSAGGATAGAATGNVSFMDGTTTLKSVSLANGTATFSASSLAVGSHTITAVYAGDANFGGSTAGNPVTQVVNQAASTTSVVSSLNPSVFGQLVTFTATVSPVAPAAGTATGSVTFMDGTTSLGNVAVVNGTAAFSTSALSIGSHNVTAVYGGDGNFTASTSSPALAQVVNKAATATTVGSSLSPSLYGQSVALTATVSVVAPGTGTATGSVSFMDGTTSLGSAPLTGGTATFNTSALAVGSHTITAVYGGGATFAGSTSTAAVTQVVDQASTTTTLAGSPNPSSLGQTVTFTATVAAVAPATGTATGSVTFEDGTTTLGTAPLSGGTATFSTSSLTVGSHNITAVYAGDANFAASTSSPALPQVVNLWASTTSLSAAPTGTSVFGRRSP